MVPLNLIARLLSLEGTFPKTKLDTQNDGLEKVGLPENMVICCYQC